MVDKRYHRRCGHRCIRCWRNRLKHANPTIDHSTELLTTGGTGFEWTRKPVGTPAPNSRMARWLAGKPEPSVKQQLRAQRRQQRAENLLRSQPDRTKLSSLTGRASFYAETSAYKADDTYKLVWRKLEY